ncbi:uncharacterized protein LOC142073335 [Caretta caretta]|uniref:uncharacterized protein LOC142073335 n=1 Tax=Caretta caretta TaxID=8467 RepID=UPI003F4C884C
MESQNRKRAPAWTEREVRDLIAVWGEESVLSELRSSFQNAKTFLKISQGMMDRGHNRDPKQCRVKLKELRQAYQKTREANSRSGSEPQTCRFYDELHAILGGSATTTPAVLFDSFNGDGGNTEVGFGDEEDDDEEVVDSSQQASGETGFPDSQELFLTLDLEPVPPEPTQGCLLDSAGGEGTSAACVSMITGSSPSQRLVKPRKKKKRTRDEMFSELMLSSHTDRAQTNAWRQIMSECRKAQNDREERWRAEESKWRAEESKWRAEDRAEAQRWRQRDERRQDSMLRLLQDQTSMLQCMKYACSLPLKQPCDTPVIAGKMKAMDKGVFCEIKVKGTSDIWKKDEGLLLNPRNSSLHSINKTDSVWKAVSLGDYIQNGDVVCAVKKEKIIPYYQPHAVDYSMNTYRHIDLKSFEVMMFKAAVKAHSLALIDLKYCSLYQGD